MFIILTYSRSYATLLNKKKIPLTFILNLNLQKLKIKMNQQLNDTNSTTSSTTSISTNASQSTNKFMKTFKNLFDIFDPTQKGYINLNELESLGANQNEILNDIIKYVRANDGFVSQVIKSSRSKRPEFNITFDNFVRAADVVIKKRKISKSNGQKMQKTLSEEFCEPLTHAKSLPDDDFKLKKQDSFKFSMKNANSCDLNKLIDEENSLLKLGITNLDKLKHVFENKLIQNQIKLANNLKLKHQNLFSIDKMLINLRELNNMNKLMGDYLTSNPKTIIDSNIASTELHKISSDLVLNDESENLLKIYDKTIKEKQNRISNLQKEKSLLIRKIFEMKSLSSHVTNNEDNNLNELLVGKLTNKKQEDYLFD